MGILALVAGQDVEPAEDSDGRGGRWRITRGTAPGRMVSTVDPEARHVHKTRSRQQDGFKAHLAIEPETGSYTGVALLPGAGPEHHEAAVGLELLADEDTPVDAFGDTAYSSAPKLNRYGKDSDPLIVLTAAAAVKLGLPEHLEGHEQPRSPRLPEDHPVSLSQLAASAARLT